MGDNASDETAGPASAGADTESETERQAEPETEQPARRSLRGRLGMRDMLLSMVVLAVGVLILAAISQGFSFSPGGASSDTSNLQPVDVPAELQAAVGQAKFPLREPRLPAGWRANSDSVDPIGGNGTDQAVRVGWITPGGRYLQLSQSNGTVPDLVRSAAGIGSAVPVAPQGTVTVNGTQWTVYPGVRSESSWVVDLGPVRLFITGNGTTDEFRTLAVAALGGRPVTAAGP
ncbi:MAG TPA: DUF4245 domain-containing protein [Pseudonocardiaceae bacterium]|nr:DUF4245 domain-containing protein [Pseudonocardiaceae bacterium]